MRRLAVAVVTATLIVSMLQGGIPEARAGGGATVFYLALGDSVAVGFQPGRGETTGYVGRVWRSIRPQIPGLRLRNMSCVGETSGSMTTGRHSACHYAAGSQLDAAVSFLEGHPGEVAFITIDIGGNDLIGRCMDRSTGLVERTCAVEQRRRLQARLTGIIDALTAAGPGVPIVGMTYYNPLLGFWGLVPGGRALARADQRAWVVLNAGLATAYDDAGATVADVAASFRIDDFTDTVVVPGRGRYPGERRHRLQVDVVLLEQVLHRLPSELEGLPEDRRSFHRELQALLP